MKKIIVGIIVVAVGAAFLVNRGAPKPESKTVATGEKSGTPGKSLTPIPLPKEFSDFQKPETIADAQKKIRESSEFLKKQLIPLMKQMPGEVRKMEALMKQNDELINALARTTEFTVPSEPAAPESN